MRLLLLFSILCLNSSLSFAIEKDISSKDDAELDRIFAELEQQTQERLMYKSERDQEFQMYNEKFQELFKNAINLDLDQPFECRINIKLLPTTDGFIVRKVTMLYDSGHCTHIPEAIETLQFPMPKNKELIRRFQNINFTMQSDKVLKSE
ncbi:cell envelope integrity protein TolA [Vibrio parahaemolyticus]|nr:cell envelope integrity protein TolA [Vibrio parahaemolyticus]